jgi:hypothetical protein
LSSADALVTTQPALPIVQTDDGPVTVAALEYLEQIAATKTKRVEQLGSQAADAEKQSADAMAQAGWQLIAHQAEWKSTDWAGRIDAARGLGQLVANLQQQISEVSARPHQGLGGVFHRVTDSQELNRLKKQLDSTGAELDNRYRDVAAGVEPSTGIPEADQLLRRAADLRGQASALAAEKEGVSRDLMSLNSEIARRKDVIKELGFDALGTHADLDVNGIRPISTNLVLKSKEIAAFEAPATLCRWATRTQYVGGSHGVSIPLGHGFRYRVSSFRGHPVQSQSLTRVDTGQLVVTNQRLVFMGSKKDVSTPVAKVIHLEPYSDAVGIGREGKESRDVYLVPQPARLMLYLQWIINHQS